MSSLTRPAAIAAAIAILAGCAVTSVDEAASNASRRVTEHTTLAPAWPPAADGAATPVPPEPLDLPAALAFAFEHNTDIRRQYARLGIAQADLQAAARISNPTLSLTWLDPAGGGRDKTTRGITATFTDLLLLPSRRRLSAGELRRTELAVAASLVALAKDVEKAWYSDVGAAQVAVLEDKAAETAETAFELAGRYHAAGNLPQLQLDEERAQAARARIKALETKARAADARAGLATLLGLHAADTWRTVDGLPAPPDRPLPGDGLAAMALAQRLDLAALDEELALSGDALATSRRWRLLGPVVAGYERERDSGGTTLRGPTVALAIPVFDQGQGAVARGDARLLDARARRDALALAIENDVAAGVERLEIARAIAATHRDAWLPAATSAVDRRQERVNYMLEGVFTLLRARSEQFKAGASWIESVRDYWIARAELRAAVGTLLPGDDEARLPTIDADTVLAAAPGDKQHHGEGP